MIFMTAIDEFRYITFGVSNSGRLLVVVHTERENFNKNVKNNVRNINYKM